MPQKGPKIEDLFDTIEVEYSKCWSILHNIKKRVSQETLAEGVLSFQTVLSEALFRLERRYVRLAEEKSDIVRRRDNLKPVWWKGRLATIAEHQEAIEEVMCIGKCIGDAFVYCFYFKDQEKLAEHLNHNRVLHLPPGVGGMGELEIMRGVPKLDRFFILYHGITNILRVGDVSLIDLQTGRVRSIGDIKTKKVAENQIQVTIFFVGTVDKEHLTFQVRARREEGIGVDLPQRMKPRLSRQLAAMEKLFQDNQDRSMENERIMGQHHVKELEGLILNSKCSRAIAQRVDDGLVITTLRHKKQKFARKFLGRTSHDSKAFSEVISETIKTLSKKESDNLITIGTLLYEGKAEVALLPGGIPLFWWPIDMGALRMLYFQDVVALTIFNHAHLVESLKGLGLSITRHHDDKRLMKVTKIEGGRKLELTRFDYFLSLVQNYLFSEKAIIDLITLLLTRVEKENIKQNARINLQILQRLN
jgi:uncharacterized protein YeeX (DUF496 family)